jgi:hypothetical protein
MQYPIVRGQASGMGQGQLDRAVNSNRMRSNNNDFHARFDEIQGVIKHMKNVSGQTENNYLKVFDRLFKEEMKRFKTDLKNNEHKHKEFSLAELKIKEIEELCNEKMQESNDKFSRRVTRVDNQMKSYNRSEMQKEMLMGKYSINLKDEMPFKEKVV